MICRLFAGIGILVLCATPPAARAQSDPLVVDIQGPCLLMLGGRPVQCVGVAYMIFPDTGRIDFTAVTDKAGWAFSGEQDRNQDGRYSLAVDSMVSPSASRVQAQGECDMALDADGRTVRLIQCLARTPAGTVVLKASGTASADDNDDDNDDDGDDDSAWVA